MRRILTVVLFLIVCLAHAQINMRPILRNYGESQRTSQQRQDAINLPFWDDFSTSGNEPDSLWEFSGGVTVNTSLSKNPPTYKAATLDGVDSLGRAYDDQDNFAGLTDQLVSRRIDLSALVNDNSIYLSFFWEGGGFAEAPEDPGDSLRLQFLNTDSIWVTVWKKHAIDLTTTEDFEQEILPVQPSFRHQDFRFKFEAFGSQFGPFDSWHIDYVYMDNVRSSANQFYDDQALTGSITPLVTPYREMPAEHFFADPSKFLVVQAFQSFDLSSQNLETLTMNVEIDVVTESGLVEMISYQDILDLQGPQIINYDTLDANNEGAGDIENDPVIITPISPAPDSAVLNFKLSSNFTDQYPVNDTIRDSYLFHDYYAYDDGEPEFAAGVAQNGSVAIEYVIAAKDTLTHVDIYFPTIHPTPVGKTVFINVWKKLNGSDPVETKTLTVTEDHLNQFTRVKLSSPVIVDDTVYVGYKQKTNLFLGVGLDKNNTLAKSKMWYLANTWQKNETLEGILMIRPVFQGLSEIVLNTASNSEIQFYPNPFTTELTIQENYESIKIWTINGQLKFAEQRKDRHDLSALKSGIYVLEILNQETSERALLRKD